MITAEANQEKTAFRIRPVSPFQIIQNICFGFDPESPWIFQGNAKNGCRSLEEGMKSALKRYVDEADGDIGLFLSGIDSTYIGALLLQMVGPCFKTYTFAFDGVSACQEDVSSARMISKRWGVQHHILTMNPDAASKIFNSHDACRVNGQINSFQMAAYASEMQEQMPALCLTGIGADEMMGSSLWIRKYHRMQRLPIPAWIRRSMAKILRKLHKPRYEKYINPPLLALNLRTLFPPAVLQELNSLADPVRIIEAWLQFWYALHPGDDMERFQRLLFRLDLEEIQIAAYRCFGHQTKTDVRYPYLAPEVMGYWNQIPIRKRWRSGAKKKILRQHALSLLPADIANRPKVGLTWPWEQMIRNGLYQKISGAIFDSPWFFEKAGFKKEKIQTLWKAYHSGRPSAIGPLGWVRLALKALSLNV